MFHIFSQRRPAARSRWRNRGCTNARLDARAMLPRAAPSLSRVRSRLVNLPIMMGTAIRLRSDELDIGLATAHIQPSLVRVYSGDFGPLDANPAHQFLLVKNKSVHTRPHRGGRKIFAKPFVQHPPGSVRFLIQIRHFGRDI